MTLRDQRPVDVRAESAVFEAELEGGGIDITRCECGTAELEPIPDRDVGFRCAGCKRVMEG